MAGLAQLKMIAKYDNSTAQQRYEAAEEDLEALVQQSRAKDAIMVSIRDECFKCLASYGLGECRICGWMETGFHPWNRSTSGIVPAKVSLKVEAFHTCGISLLECSKAVSVGRGKNAGGDSNEKINSYVCNNNDYLASVKKGTISQFSLTCNHTCQAVRAVMCEARHDNTDIAPQGYIKKAFLESRQSAFSATSRDGMVWFQIDPIVEEHKPAIIRIIIESDNVPNAIAQKDTSSTMLWKCFYEVRDVFSDPAHNDLDDKEKYIFAEAKILRTALGRANEVPHYMEFVKQWSGSSDDPFVLKEYEEFIKARSEVRDINAQIIGKLAAAKLGTGACVWWRLACLKLHSNPTEKPLQVSEVAAMSSDRLRRQVHDASERMMQSRIVCTETKDGVEIGRLQKARDLLDQRLGKHVRKRSKDYKSLNDVCITFLDELCEAGAAPVCPDPPAAPSIRAAQGRYVLPPAPPPCWSS